jgi:hypothetical protein
MISEFIHNHSILLLKVILIIAVIQFITIVLLCIYIKKKIPKLSDEEMANRKKLKEAKQVHIDMNGLLDSINKAKALYKDLSKKCHPDRFTEHDMKEKANSIIQLITQNKNNYAVLLELKSKAEQELNIQFN